MVKNLFNFNKINPGFTKNAPFSKFYRGYFFVSIHALEQMYYGVSEKAFYVGFSALFADLCASSKSASIKLLDYKTFSPVPNLFLPQNQLRSYLQPFIEGKKLIFGYKPNTVYFNFFGGLFLYVIWKLGGGNRAIPLHDPERTVQYYGFYDLRFTPLAILFKLYIKLSFFFNILRNTNTYNEYYLFNLRSVVRGFGRPAIPTSRICDYSRNTVINFFIWPILTFPFEFVLSLIFNVFFRTFYYRGVMRRGRIQKYLLYVRVNYDMRWVRMYWSYINDVVDFYQNRFPDLKRMDSLDDVYTYKFISTYYARLYDKHMVFRTRRYNRYLKNIYTFRNLLIAPEYSVWFFHKLEAKKFNKFKRLILTDTTPNFFYRFSVPLFRKLNVKFLKFSVNEYLQLFKSKFLFNDGPSYKDNYATQLDWFNKERRPTRNNLKGWEFKQEDLFKDLDKMHFVFYRSMTLKRLRFFLTDLASPLRFFVEFFEKLVNLPIKWLFIFYSLVIYRLNKRISQFFIYKLKLNHFTVKNTLYRFFEFYFASYLPVDSILQFFKSLFVPSYNFVCKAVKTTYNYFFNFVYYTLFVLFIAVIYTYYEIRFAGIYFIESLRKFTKTFVVFGRYTSHFEYLGIFKKFFIGAKFFRFFTRDVGEDLEETPFNIADDLEDDYVVDYLNNSAAYFDFQTVSEYDGAYNDDEDDTQIDGFNTHYFDYWLPTATRSIEQAPLKPNFEFYADDNLSAENDWFFQIFAIWLNPTLAELSNNATEPLPYEIKDAVDDFSMHPGDWFPNEVSQSEEYEEDHLEYYMDSSYDQAELSETFSMLPVPFDSDRSKLINFTKLYSKKLKKWHSYQITNNFIKLPDVLKLNGFSAVHKPVNFGDWKKATLVASEFFIPKRELKKFKLMLEAGGVTQINLVWERIAYELEKNPKKIYGFLDQKSEDMDIFKSLFFKTNQPTSSSFYQFFKKSSFEPKFIEFLGDYFMSKTSASVLEQNPNFKLTSRYDILYAFYLFKTFADKDFTAFYAKSTNFSEISFLTGLHTNFIKYSKHFDRNFVVTETVKSVPHITSSIGAWAGTAYYERVKSLRPRPRLPKVFDYVHLGWDYLWQYYYVHWKTRLWPAKPSRTWGWRRQFKLPLTEVNYPPVNNTRVGYESIFSLFLEERFFFISFKGAKKKFARVRSRLFGSYKPAGLYYFMLDGEDYQVQHGELFNDPIRKRRRSYFFADQLIEADLWNTLNPNLDELFYELYYLNSNIFFPTQFSDNLFEEVLADDELDNSQDIYDDYVYIGGVDDFDRNLGANREEYIVNEDELLDDDPDTLDASDESVWDDYDHQGRMDEGLIRGQETGGEAPDHYSERYWYNSDQWFKLEHIDNDEGLEEWEFDEYEAMYDVDLSLDRFFFGGLKRSGSFPATDQRIFLGPLWEHSLDKDLDYKHNFNLAKKNVESKAVVVSNSAQKDYAQPGVRSYFSWSRFFVLNLYKFFVFFVYYVDHLINGFFSEKTQSAAVSISNLKLYHHYLVWYNQYTAFYAYKFKLLDWIKFFEAFENPLIFKQYKKLHVTFLVHEFQKFDYLSDTYGRFWLQFPFNNYLNEFAQYNDANIIYTDPFYYDYLIKTKGREKVHLYPKDLDAYYPDYTKQPLTGGMLEHTERKFFDTTHRFFASDPLYNSLETNRIRKQKLLKLTSYPWFMEGSRHETLGSDFIYLDLNFVEDMPEDDEFFDYHKKDFAFGLLPTYNQHTDFFFKWVEQRRSGAAVGHHLPNDGILDGFAFEEIDWDIGSMVSYSVDDFNSHLDEFTKKIDIFFNAVLDFYDLIIDYTNYYFYSKFRKYVLARFYYWETQSNSSWLVLAARYGIWVLFIRNFINFSLFLALFIYGFFVISRLLYFFFGEIFSYGAYSFLLFFSSFLFIVLLARWIFKPFNDFYKSLDYEEKFEIIFFMLFAWYFYNLNGYFRGGHYILSEENTADMMPMISDHFTADFRTIGADYTPGSGFTHRPELDKQGWLFRKATIAPRIYKTQYHPGYDKLPPDRHYWWYSFGVTPYPTYFNPYNFFNFVKFHLFNVSNQNFVGYKDVKRYKYEPTSLQVVDNSHIILHRPQILNWMHMHTLETRVWIKAQIMEHAYSYLACANPHLYVNLTLDRVKYNNIVFTNPINPRPYATTPHTFFSADRPSSIPYDFRPKFSSDLYSRNVNYKINSIVQNNFELVNDFNKRQIQPNKQPFLFYPDKPKYTFEESEDKNIVKIKNYKYRQTPYKSFRSKYYFTRFNRYSLYENTANVRWTQDRIFSNNFAFDYATNFRKYMFYFNPRKAQSMREVYGLSIRDVLPYPEFATSRKRKIPKLFFNEVFRQLTRKERGFVISLIKLENEMSARTATFHSLEFLQGKSPEYFLYSSYNATPPYKLSSGFYKDYISIFNKLQRRFKKTVSPDAPQVVAPKYVWYLPLIKYDQLKYNFNNSLTKLKFESISGVESDFVSVLKSNSAIIKSKPVKFRGKLLRYKTPLEIASTSKNPKIKAEALKKLAQRRPIREFDYLSKIAYSNRLRRARVANAYFRSAKASNKFSTQDYFRDYSFYLNPHAVTQQSYNSTFMPYVNGFSEKPETFDKSIYDSYKRRGKPKILLHSSWDNRSALTGYNKNLINSAAYEQDRRDFLNRKYRNKLNDLQSKYFEKVFSDFSWWDYFLEFSQINKFFRSGYSNLVQPHTLPHKYIKFFYTTNRRARINYYSDGSMSNYNFDTHILNRNSWLKNYNLEQKRINKYFNRSFNIKYEDDETIEHLLRYTYADTITGIERPAIVSDRLNLRKPHLFARLRRNHWYELSTTPIKHERHRKPFFGPSIIDEDFALHGGKKYRFEYTINSFTANHHLVRGYMWSNFLQRVKTQFPKRFKKSNIPANQKFLEFFAYNTTNIEDFVAEYEAPLTVRTWERTLGKKFALPLPYNFSKPETFPVILKGNTAKFSDIVTRENKLFEELKQRAIAKNKLKMIKRILENKKRVAKFHKHARLTSRYFKKLREQGIYDTRGQAYIVNKRDMRRYRELMFTGIDRADEEKGEAEIILYRARKCRNAQRQRKEKLKKKQ